MDPNDPNDQTFKSTQHKMEFRQADMMGRQADTMKRQVLNYVSCGRYNIDVRDVARNFGIQKREANKYLYMLQKDGMIYKTCSENGSNPRWHLSSISTLSPILSTSPAPIPRRVEGTRINVREKIVAEMTSMKKLNGIVWMRAIDLSRRLDMPKSHVNKELYTLKSLGKVVRQTQPDGSKPTWRVTTTL